MRTSKALVENTFHRFLMTIGGERARWDHVDGRNVSNVGGYRLDHNSVYGGWVIEQNVNEAGGIRRPFSDTRMPAGQLVDAMHFAMAALSDRDANGGNT